MNELRYRILPGSTNQALLITRQNLEILMVSLQMLLKYKTKYKQNGNRPKSS